MTGLTGKIRGTDQEVTTNDIIGRRNGINDLKEIKDWNLKENTVRYKIDLLHKNRRGGCDVEEGHWRGLYRNQNSMNFNKFTLPVPTANFPWRKEHFLNLYYEWISNNGYEQKDDQPDFEYNSLWRYNHTYDEAFFVDHEIYKKRYKTGFYSGMVKDHGYWKTDTISAGKPEFWMCWELKDVEFWIKVNGIWKRDTTFDDPKVYKDFVDNYLIEREKYLNANKK